MGLLCSQTRMTWLKTRSDNYRAVGGRGNVLGVSDGSGVAVHAMVLCVFLCYMML